MKEATPRPKQATHKDTFKYEDALRVTFAAFSFEELQMIGGLELPKLGHSRTNHGLGTFFKKNSKMNTYLFRGKTTIGSAATHYKCPGQGPWKHRDFKRSRGEQRIGNESRPTITAGGAHRDVPSSSALRCNGYLWRRPEKQADSQL
ncbi:hypothetical protein M9H77_02837 [Catharanthus roseus]|uniref:Uncharacterized protein n=1 Tax=Catharanthus roseus TaxID=4058 RepID=A0ACC0C9N8_CATRO|nr:hypothetical protein M9H77_02837 [Catharanthus roseus]